MDGAEVGVLKEAHQVGFAGFLKGHHSRALKAQVGLEVLGNFPDKALEGELAEEQLGGLLVAPDLAESNCPRPVPVRLLDASRSRSRLPGGLRSQLLPGCLASGGLPSGLPWYVPCLGWIFN